jgi:ribosomal protein RSM22 (predicted rRNA methylase)
MTIPKSQGKQAFYDARKSSWGDIFPHPSKNKPQERQHVIKPGSPNVAGSDIGKRKFAGRDEKTTYEGIARSLREARKSKRVQKPLWDDDDGEIDLSNNE